MRILAAVTALSILVVQNASAQYTERFSVAGNRVAVFNIAGEVRVEPGTGNAVIVEVIRGGEDSDRLSVKTGEMDDWRTLRVIYPSDRIVYPRLGRWSHSNFSVNEDGTFGGSILRATLDETGFHETKGFRVSMGRNDVRVSGNGSGLEAWADLRVLVPANQTVALHLGVGKVSVTNVHGEVRVEARSGSVSATGVDGALMVASGSGSVTLDGARGHVHINTGSGSVRASNVANGTVILGTGSGSIEGVNITSIATSMHTGSGSIRLDDVTAPEFKLNTGSGGISARGVNARDLALETGSGSITLELLSDVRNARLDTGSGSVTLMVPRELGAELIVETGSGGISADLPIQIAQQKRSHLRGRLGDGNGRIEIDTGSGGVRLRGN
jgi:lia operon protein LiaG